MVAIYGGASITDQAKQVKKGAQIVVATPGRMQDMINRRMVDISKIESGKIKIVVNNLNEIKAESYFKILLKYYYFEKNLSYVHTMYVKA